MHSNVASLQENATSTKPDISVTDTRIIGALDQPIASGLRLWMLLAMIFGVLLLMMIIVCCFIKIRIPRTKREIELDAALRRKKRICNAAEIQTGQGRSRISTKVIVMSSLPQAHQSLLSASSGGMEADFEGSPNLEDTERRRSSGKIKV